MAKCGFKIEGRPDTKELRGIDDIEDYKTPPIITVYSLDGNLSAFEVYYNKFLNNDLLV